MRKFLSLLLATCLCTVCLSPLAIADQTELPASALSSLTHNCPNTEVMLPAEFNPQIYTYLLTVASWVSRVTFIPVSVDPNAVIKVNGSKISSGQTSQVFEMSDEPQIVTISVTTANLENSLYGIYLQRRPSDERTKVSAGYFSDIHVDGGVTYMVMDLVTVEYTDGNAVGFTNDAVVDRFTYPVSNACIFYYGPPEHPMRANDLADFKAHVTAGTHEMYQIVYIEGEIVMVLPFAYGLVPTP